MLKLTWRLLTKKLVNLRKNVLLSLPSNVTWMFFSVIERFSVIVSGSKSEKLKKVKCFK